MLTPDRSDREQGLGSAWGPGRLRRWTAWGRGWAELPELQEHFLSCPAPAPGLPLLSSPVGRVCAASCPRNRLTHQTLLPPHQGKFCIFLPIPAWHGLPAPSRPGPEQRPQGTLLATPQPLKKGRQSPQREGPGLLQAPPQGSRSRDWLVRGRGDGSAVPCVTGGGPPLHPWPQFPHPQSRSSHRCPAQL